MSERRDSELVVAVTGHRELADREAVTAALEDAISAIEQALPRQMYRLLSPLAEGVDRLAATVILLRPLWKLWSILPLPVEGYHRSFSSTASRSEFDALLKKTQSTIVLRPPDDRIEAYRKLGIYLVNHCHMLLAVWDGLPARGPGGTAGFARKIGLPLALIRLNGGVPETNGPVLERFPPPMHTPQEDSRINGHDR